MKTLLHGGQGHHKNRHQKKKKKSVSQEGNNKMPEKVRGTSIT